MRHSEVVKRPYSHKEKKCLAVGAPNGHGEIFTRREVVEFILDIAGYTSDKPLFSYRLLEPSFGLGDFLEPVIERLLAAYKRNFSDFSSITKELSEAIRAVEVNRESVNTTHEKLLTLLRKFGVAKKDAVQLLDAWIIEGDFLLVDLPHLFTHAVGNPPYVRQELIPKELIAKYRAEYTTIYDRADLYIPFIERCLTNIEPGGTVGFICADRWMKNKYGKPLRAMISKNYHLVYYVDMIDTPAFHKDVIAYPAITVIKREKPKSTRIACRPEINKSVLGRLAKDMKATTIPPSRNIVEIADAAKSQEPWILQSSAQLTLVRRLEARFPFLEDAGCKVGIGVATGADKVFTGPFDKLDVEPDRKLPLVKTKDIRSGTIEWQGLGVINPFRDGGSLVSLDEYPKLSKYFKKYSAQILKRHVAKKNPKGWYRTIDRIYPDLTHRPKLLIPDIQGEALIVYDDGHFYPHHNLYYITSEEWDLKALQAVLRSGIAKLFISLYSTRMRGGYFRYQAQYLRRIRLPRWKDIPGKVRKTLLSAAKTGEVAMCNKATFDLYGLTCAERIAIEGNGGGGNEY